MLEAIHAQESKKAAREKAIKRSRNFPSGKFGTYLTKRSYQSSLSVYFLACGKYSPSGKG
ncbi:hypothetical protein HMPREF1986_00213 [Oribacterium sp. oral taxon 078 str. F0263]|nr:hypothetical protein HMPREF1986_00213 [Oribacterium sp. oral taxon 078 str. F0263]